jgi:hypothetical protein
MMNQHFLINCYNFCESYSTPNYHGTNTVSIVSCLSRFATSAYLPVVIKAFVGINELLRDFLNLGTVKTGRQCLEASKNLK